MSQGLSECSLWIISLTLKRENFIAGDRRLRDFIYVLEATQQIMLELEAKCWQPGSRARAHSHKYPGRTGTVTPMLQMRKLRP